jgi:hypothetical protein
MRIDAYQEDGDLREKVVTFTINGIDKIAQNDVA